ncbi:MAG: flagellar hook capping FlgD N-terminal domain-containing protein [Desulfobacterales bacterium]
MNNVSALHQQGAQPEAQKSNFTQTLGKNDFLSLLVTQLQNQDPLKPMDPTQFTAQLAQFSSLEQLYNINENIQMLKSIQGSFDRLSALSMIDKYVVSDSRTFQFTGDPLELGFRFDEKVRDATLYIQTPNGQTVCNIVVANPSAEEHFVQWDGKDQDGWQLPEGTYSLAVIGTTEDGNPIAGTTLAKSQITGVDLSGTETILMTTNGKVMLSEISKVNNSTLSANDD